MNKTRIFLTSVLGLLLTVTALAKTPPKITSDPKIRIGNVDIQLVVQNSYRYDRFHYYPRYEVYYSYHQDLYFWFDRGRWHRGYHLPYALRKVHRDRYIIVHGRYDRPWQYDGKRRY